MKSQSLFSKAVFAIFSFLYIVISGLMSAQAGETRVLRGHLPPASALAQPLGRLPGTNSLRLAITLPLHNTDAMAALMQRLYNPASPDYHHYLTPAQFTEQFGPTPQDYQTVIQFAASSGLEVVANRDSRMVLDIRGKASDIEKAFHVTLQTYQHPTENRRFYAPDVEPTVDAALPILDIVGLGDYALPRPGVRMKPRKTKSVSASGSAGGNYIGSDFRHAYAPGVTLNGAGQMVGLLEFDNYYPSDITTYESQAGLTNIPVVDSPQDGFDTNSTPGSGDIEVSLDIEVAMAMAPGLAAVVVFQAPNSSGTTGWIDILDSMAASNQITQFSSSWGYTGSPDPNTSNDTEFQKMAMDGQSFFQASGDGDAWIEPIWVPADSPYLTSVGGTLLTMNGTGASYASETVWNEGNQGSGNEWSPNYSNQKKNDYIGSGGGISTVYNTIPSWQKNAINSTNAGSSSKRNIPDVSLTGDDIYVVALNGESGGVAGTSCAAPLWAGFTALINQQAAAGGDAPVGFINPAIYALGQTTNYTSCFHDITTGNNINNYSSGLWSAVPGYDLCTGWGTPNGLALINALLPELYITPPAGFVASGPFGGPFSVVSQNFTLTNIGTAPFNWSLVNTSSWLTASLSSGTLTPGGATANASIGLNSAASNLSVGFYSNTISFTNLTAAMAEGRQFTLTITKAAPALTWANPAAITYGSALTSNQLNATANTPGNFAYTPTIGTILSLGNHTLSVVFTPSNANYFSATTNVSVVVSTAPLTVTANNTNRSYGAANPPFTGTIIGVTNGDNITAAYNCSATINSPAGPYLIVPSLVDPNNRQTNYTVTLNDGTLNVTMAAPMLNWAALSAITYPTALGPSQLDATANVPGNFAYTPSAGAILGPGTNLLDVIFTPSDPVDYSNATNSVNLVVTLAPIPLNISLVNSNVVLSWYDPDSVFTLQAAPAVNGVFTNVPGAASPCTNAVTNAQQFFQLMAN